MITWLKKGARQLLKRCLFVVAGVFCWFVYGIEVLFPTYAKAGLSQPGPSMPHFGLDVASGCISAKGREGEEPWDSAFLS